MKHSDKYRNWFDSEQLVSDLMDQAADDIDQRDKRIETLQQVVRDQTAHGVEQMKEIERLLEALKVIADSSEEWGAFAEAALQQKESE